MKTIRNKTHRPIKIRLPGGKLLHLGPAKTGQVSDQASELASFRKHVEDGEIEILGEGESGSATGSNQVVQESTHGHAQPTVVLPKGNR
jgi:hypothetical protein